jgi:hypothetical protein
VALQTGRIAYCFEEAAAPIAIVTFRAVILEHGVRCCEMAGVVGIRLENQLARRTAPNARYSKPDQDSSANAHHQPPPRAAPRLRVPEVSMIDTFGPCFGIGEFWISHEGLSHHNSVGTQKRKCLPQDSIPAKDFSQQKPAPPHPRWAVAAFSANHNLPLCPGLPARVCDIRSWACANCEQHGAASFSLLPGNNSAERGIGDVDGFACAK